MEEKESLVRKKALNRISSPDQLSDYLKVTNPGIWLILACVGILLGGLLTWSAVGTVEILAEARVIVSEGTGFVVLVSNEAGEIQVGNDLRIVGEDYVISQMDVDGFRRPIGVIKASLPDGEYEGTVVLGRIHPLSYLLRGW